jgi:II/X family phage/plasmid replication protein
MIDWFRGEIPFKHIPLASGRVLSIDIDGVVEWESVKSIYCRGSHESSIKIKSSGGDGYGNATTLMIDGNLSKFLQGHNIFGSLDMNFLVLETFKKIYEQHKQYLQVDGDIELVLKRTLKAISKGEYLVKMLDINFLFELNNDESVESWLHACEMNARTRNGRSVRDKGTVYLQKHSRRWAFKFYNKYRECILTRSKKHKLNIELTGMGLENFIKGKLRAELRLMSLELKEFKLTHGKHLSENKLKQLFNEYMGKINMSNQVTLIDEQLLKLPRTLQSTYQLWRQGASLKDLMNINTYYKHRKRLIELTSIDISFPPTNPEKRNNVVPLMRILEAKPVDTPIWAYEKGLIAA